MQYRGVTLNVISVHPYCAGNSRRNVRPRHASSARDNVEMYTNTAAVGIVASVLGLKSLNCMVIPGFLSIVYFVFLVKTKKF